MQMSMAESDSRGFGIIRRRAGETGGITIEWRSLVVHQVVLFHGG